MIRPRVILWIGLAAIVGVSLFVVKYEVQSLDEHLLGLEKEKLVTERSIHVLEAEWAHLNHPERLERLAKKYLNLHPANPKQLIVYDSVDYISRLGNE
tara:strand:- start:15427 stop:15720 length:294 start_codon:yes stop_codon:yes gene_type:complete